LTDFRFLEIMNSIADPMEAALLSQTTATQTIHRNTRSVAAEMADFITAHTASNGSVSRDDLLLDFTEADITEHFEAAKKLARNAGKARR
jgi:hypothetical protein